MKLGIVIPYRGVKVGKTRLRRELPNAEVDALSARMLANVVRAVRNALPEAPTVLITRDRAGVSVSRAVSVLKQPLDLNEAIAFARGALAARGADRIMVINSDLPLLQPADIVALLAPAADVVIAPDRAGRGTNAMVFPSAAVDLCCFGADSAQRHAERAAARKLSAARVHNAALSHDVDTVEDIDDAVRIACAPPRGRN